MVKETNIKNPITGETFSWDDYFANTDTILVYELGDQHLQALNVLASISTV